MLDDLEKRDPEEADRLRDGLAELAVTPAKRDNDMDPRGSRPDAAVRAAPRGSDPADRRRRQLAADARPGVVPLRTLFPGAPRW